MTTYHRNSEINKRLVEMMHKQKQHSAPPLPSRKTDIEIVNETLNEENKKLKEKYDDLVEKANKLVAAYRKLDTKNKYLMNENQVLKQKKINKERAAKKFTDVSRVGLNVYQRFIKWLKT